MTDLEGAPVTTPQLAPHPPLTRYYSDESERRRWVRRIFDSTAVDYDRIELLMALGMGHRYRRDALERAGLQPAMDILDVGSGTGLTAVAAEAIVGSSGKVLQIDPSLGMLTARRPRVGRRAIAGCAEDLPVADARWDFVTMGFALRHVGDLHGAFTEFRRALRLGGRLCVLEITQPQSEIGRRVLRFYMRRWLPFVAAKIGRTNDLPRLMRYYWDSTEACLPPSGVLTALRDAGFVDVKRHVEMGIFSEYTATKAWPPSGT